MLFSVQILRAEKRAEDVDLARQSAFLLTSGDKRPGSGRIKLEALKTAQDGFPTTRLAQ